VSPSLPPDSTHDDVPGRPVTRSEVLRRAHFWVANQVHYLTRDSSPDEAPGPDGHLYRTDCSGYVCMAWFAGSQPSTAEFDELGEQIDAGQLLPGDALLWKGEGGYGPDGGHVLLFQRWASPERDSYVAYELAGARAARSVTLPFPYLNRDPRYVPWRYRAIMPG
jgi:hypothetical protein